MAPASRRWEQNENSFTGACAGATFYGQTSSLPPSALRRCFREARRILKPGGLFSHLDFYAIPGGEIGKFFHFGHSARNREHYMVSLCKMDLVAELEAAGFEDVLIAPFEEEDGTLANGGALPKQWRFPWTTITARAKP